MGISGLLPYLKSAARQINIKEFKGCTVAVDSYCWLHKGTFSCADKLVLGEPTEQYVYYCMKYVRNLLSMGIRPIMVFDGCSLPSKKDVEKQRRERREVNKKKAADLLREGRRAEARDAFRMCIDITSEMALNLMKACREIGVDCIVAPYEADAQLAYLNKIGAAQIIITEDSDLLLFGCERVMFKMDIAGNGVLVEQTSINKALGMKADCYSFEKFRYICILSGCDYQASLPGIGLKKATLIFQRTRQPDMSVVIKKIPTTLNMKTLTVTPAYIEGFFRANNTFLHQLVYDPTRRKLVPLNPYPPGTNQSDFIYAGPSLPEDLAYQLALGNLSVHNMQKIYDFDPDTFQPKSRPKYNKESKDMLHCSSIWDRNYRPPPKIASHSRKNTEVETHSTLGKEMTVHVKSGKVESDNVKHEVNVKQEHVKQEHVKRRREEEDISEKALLSLYSSPTNSLQTPPSQQAKRRKSDTNQEQKHSVEDSQVLSDLSELLHEAQDGDSKTTEGAQNGGEEGDKNTSLEKSPHLTDSREDKRRRSLNKFKVTRDVQRARLDLNMKSGVKVEVTSRYFSASKPTKKSTFLDAMPDKENHQLKKSPARNSEISGSSCQPLDEDQTTEVVSDDTTGERSDCTSPPEYKPDLQNNSYVKSPYGLFTFKSKLNSFKSEYDSKSSLSQSGFTKHKEDRIERQLNSTLSSSQSVIESSSQSDSFSVNNSQTRSIPGSIDQDSFNFTQNASQCSVDSLSQRSESAESNQVSNKSGGQNGGLSFTERGQMSSSLSLDNKAGAERSVLFGLDAGDEVNTDRAENQVEESDESMAKTTNNNTTSARRSLGLSKSASTTPIRGSSITKVVGGSCRSSGLKKRVTSKADCENSQTSIKSFFSKHFAYSKGNKDVLERRKPLSPTKTNVMGAV